MANIFDSLIKSVTHVLPELPEPIQEKGLSILSIPQVDNNLPEGIRPNWVSNSTGWSLVLPQTKFDYQTAVGEPILNSAVAACINWILRTFPEAPLLLQKKDASKGGVYVPVEEHPLTDLIHNPNPYYNETILWMGTLLSFNLNGNAY